MMRIDELGEKAKKLEPKAIRVLKIPKNGI
jgi:hypothetical protein